MSVSLKKESWAKKNFDKLFLVLALLALCASAVILLMQIGKASAEPGYIKPQESQLKDADREQMTVFSNIVNDISQPLQHADLERNFMVSELRVASINPQKILYPIPWAATNCPFTGAVQPIIGDIDKDGDGMRDKYEITHGLDPSDPNDAYADKDKDGYSNIEEFNADTSPSDPTSFPPAYLKLRLAKVKAVPFMLMFQGVSKGASVTNYILNSRSSGRTYFVKIGDEVLGYKLVGYEPKFGKNPKTGAKVDVSELVLTRGENETRLTKNRELRRDDKIGLLVWLGDGTQIVARPTKSFELKDEKYYLIDILRDKAKIRIEKTGKTHVVPRITPEEFKKLQGDKETETNQGTVPGAPVGGGGGA